MPIYCPRCGTQNTDWAQACQQCSSPLPSRPQGGQGFGQQQQPPPGYQQPPSYQQQPAPYGAPYGGYQQPGRGFGAPLANYASIGKRFVAYLLDALVGLVGALPGIVVVVFGAAIMGSGGRGEQDIGGLFMVLGYLVLIAGALGVGLYNIYLLGRDGATLGKRWMGIKVLDPMNQPLGFGKAFLRELVKGVVANVCIILLLWPLWDNEKQGLYDKLFSTHVYEG